MQGARRRDAHEVLARARIICLVCSLADGVEIHAAQLAELGVEPYFTAEERLWFFDEPAPTQDVWWQATAMLAMAWTLGLLADLDGGEFLDVFGEIGNRLVFEDDVAEQLAPRDERDVRALMEHFEEYARRGDDPPPNERYGAECIRWNHAGLAWVMDDRLPWPPAPETMLKVTERK